MSQFGSLDALQLDLDGEPIHLFGVDMQDEGDDVSVITDGTQIPWLLDSDQMAQIQLGAMHFELIILDENGVRVKAIDLLDFDLTDPTNYAELKAMLREMSGG